MRLTLCMHVSAVYVDYVCVIVTEWHFTTKTHSISTTLVICHSLSINRLAGKALNAAPGSAWPLGLWYLWVTNFH